MAKVKKGLYYTQEHEWVRVSGGNAYIGVTDHAQQSLGDIVYAEGEPEGSMLSPGDVCGVVESVKAASDIYSPVTGEITEINESLGTDPQSINSDPYGTWIVKIKLIDPGELDELMDAAQYEEFTNE